MMPRQGKDGDLSHRNGVYRRVNPYRKPLVLGGEAPLVRAPKVFLLPQRMSMVRCWLDVVGGFS